MPSHKVALGSLAGAAMLAAMPLARGAAVSYSPHFGSVPQDMASQSAKLQYAADPDMSMHLSVSLPLRHQQQLIALVAAQQDPASPWYRRYLTVAQFTRYFGPTTADYQAAARFFASSGLKVSADASNNYLLKVSGRVAQVEHVFNLRMGYYARPGAGRLFLAPDREPSTALSVPINHVSGLENAVVPTPRRMRLAGQAAAPGVGGSEPSGSFTGSDMRAAYYGNGPLTGAGQSVALFEFGGWNPADVTAYFASLGQTSSVPVVGVSVDGASPTCGSGCEDGEQVSDIEYAIAVAPGLSQVQVYVGGGEVDIFQQIATDDTSRQISISWGLDPQERSAEDPLYMEMAVQGQTLLTASGDYTYLRPSGPWPEESAYITGVGGSDVRTSTPGGAWQSERGWSSSAGGPSLNFAIRTPAYQAPFITGQYGFNGSTSRRNVPDLATNAIDLYDCDTGSCSGGWEGTSYSSPIMAGLVALANEEAESAGRPPVGFLNPTAYRLAGSATSATFHDITAGQSGRFKALPGYDLVTGLGSPQPGLIDAISR